MVPKTFYMEQLTSMKRKEGKVAKAIETQTSKIPSDIFLWAALGSMGVSLALKIMGRKHESLFVGQWAAPFLILGLYNKVVKVEGHDAVEK
jgi:hypothetical protein